MVLSHVEATQEVVTTWPRTLRFIGSHINTLNGLSSQTFAGWGVDMLKMDGCNADTATMPQLYLQVSEYLNATGRHIAFSCSWPAYWTGSGKKVCCYYGNCYLVV